MPDAAVAAALVLGTLLLLGVAPFSAGLRSWLAGAHPALALAAATSLLPALVAAAAASEGTLTVVHGGGRGGLLLAGFGVLTAAAGAVAAVIATDWRRLGVEGVVSDVGLALVGLASLDLAGVRGAALVLVALVLGRPLMLLAGSAGPGRWARVGLWASALTAAGLPPTVGFAARLLVLDAAFRINGALALALTLALAVQTVATLRLAVRGGLLDPGAGATRGKGRRAGGTALAAVATAAATLLAGLLPGVILAYAWNLG